MIANSGSFVSHSPVEFVISAVKESEDGDGWIIRGYNISSGEIQLKLRPNKKFAHATQVNLAEERIQSVDMAKDGSIALPVSGHKIVSIKYSN